MDVIKKITLAIEPSLVALGYDIVLIRLGEGRRKTLVIMAERRDEKAMSFDDCTEISRTVSALLDVEDPIDSAYDLEVSSPGLDRPLTKPKDFERYKGNEAKLETMLPIEGRKRFRGIVKGIDKDVITLSMKEGEMKIGFGNLRAAKLIPAFTAESGKKRKH